MNCNPDAFHWIIKVLRIKTTYDELVQEQKLKCLGHQNAIDNIEHFRK